MNTVPVRRGTCLLTGGLLLGLSLYTGNAASQQSFSYLSCRAGTLSGLAKGENIISYALDHRGIILSQDKEKTFDNFTQRCIGSVAVIAGKSQGGGFCRNVDPATGDITFVEWTASEKPGTGTFKFLYGTGKWKGISGGGEYRTAAGSRPVDDGTYQNCNITNGTFTLPKQQ